MQLGLCMGFSLISAAEVLFHAVQVILAVIIPRRSARRLPSQRHADYDGDSQVGRFCSSTPHKLLAHSQNSEIEMLTMGEYARG